MKRSKARPEQEDRWTHLGHDGGGELAVVVLPSVQTALCRHGGQIDVHPGQQASLRVVQHRVQPVPGAAAGRRSRSAAVLLQRDAAVPPRRGEVEVSGQEAAVSRRVRQEHEGQGEEAVGEDADAEEGEDGPLEASPLPQEGGGVLIVCALGCAWRGGLGAHGGGEDRSEGVRLIHQLGCSLKSTPHTSCWDQLSFPPFVSPRQPKVFS